MTAGSIRRALTGLVGMLLAGGAAALTVQELQSMLQSAPLRTTEFQEVRESPWLASPVESRGTMESNPQKLEKRVASPRQETWRLLPDRVEWVGPDGVTSKHILYSQAPSLAVLSNAMRRVVAADLESLARDFRTELAGDERRWTLRLRPIDTAVAQQLERIDLQGAGPRLQVIVVVERQGERTTTRLLP